MLMTLYGMSQTARLLRGLPSKSQKAASKEQRN